MNYNLVSLIGLFILLLLTWLFSANRRLINWRVILWGLGLQFLFAFFIFWMPAGVAVFHWLNGVVVKVLSFAREGTYFLFGPLAISPGTTGPGGETSPGFILAIQALPTVIFFSALMALLYHIRLMPKVIKGFTLVFTKLMRISGAESFCASSNIFVGIESALTVRPYLERMTHSELCTILTVGMATIASTVLGLYVGFLNQQLPTIAGHLISASILSAPAAIVTSKVLLPEKEIPQTSGQAVEGECQPAGSWVESIIRGANDGVKLCVGIFALLMAFLGLLAMANWALSALGNKLSLLIGTGVDLTLQRILSYIFYPLTLVMGVPPADAHAVASLLGERTILTELVSYQHLATHIKDGVLQDPRSAVLASYALCGFAHIASLAIFVGGIAALAPKRSKDLARLGFRALLGATLACLMTGAVAGIFFRTGQSILTTGQPF